MRNGNKVLLTNAISEIDCSYPTYEEWKLSPSGKNLNVLPRSYPTYEEWKLSKQKRILIVIGSSYPTYEEWKPYVSFLY